MRRFRVRRPRGERPGRPRRSGGPRRVRRPRGEGSDAVVAERRRAARWPEDVLVPWPDLLRFLIRNRDLDRTLWQILEELGRTTDDADRLREQLALLEKEGLLHHHRRGRIRLHTRDRLAVGRVTIPPSSRAIGRHWGASGAFGFVATGEPEGDLYLPARGLSGARHGDTVLAREIGAGRGGRTQGAVVAILRRSPSRIGGEVIEVDGRLRLRPRDDRAASELPLRGAPSRSGRIESEEGHARAGRLEVRPGDLVIAELGEEGAPVAGVVEVIGSREDPAAFEELIRAEMRLPGEFPPEAEEEAERAAVPVGEKELSGRADFRPATAITIDPEDARDFDDAISLEELPDEGLRLWVHIADVGQYVPEGGPLDREALERGTSIYFPGRVIPMLPHALSSGICSLLPGEERLVQSVGIDYTAAGDVAAVRMADGVIRSAARLTYEEAAAILSGEGGTGGRGAAAKKIERLFAAAAPLARRLTAKRLERGALDLDLPEVEFDPGKEGLLTALRVRERTEAHRLIEEFMLAANEAVARHLAEERVPSIYRVHEAPAARDVQQVESILAPLGVKRGRGQNLAARLHRILSRFAGRPEEPIIGRQVLKALKLAQYAAAPGEHFGLALQHYTHFTSPIRRFPDLVVHRILRESRTAPSPGRKPRSAPEKEATARLAEIAAEASRLERRAEQAERAVNNLVVAGHFSGRLGSVFQGRVSGTTRSGIFVALEGEGLAPGIAEGFAPAPRGKGFVLTEPVRVRLEQVDRLRGKLRLGLIED